MPHSSGQALAWLTALDGATLESVPPTPRLKANAHIHLPPNFSAFERVSQAVELSAAQEIGALGASNYYDFAVYADFAAQLRAHRIFPLFGLEIIALLDDLLDAGIKLNDPGNPGKMYLCGKGITQFAPMSPEAEALMQTIRKNDSERMAEMATRLAELFAQAGFETGLDAEAVRERIVRRHGSPRETVYLQERHLAQAFQEVLFERCDAEAERFAVLERAYGTPPKANLTNSVAVQNELRSQLMKAGKAGYVAETFVGFDHAYRLILALGGVPCYPTLADGAAPICPFESPVENLIAAIQERGIHCAEFIPIRNTPDVLTRYVTAMRQAGLVITAGTEHNTLDLLPIEPTCLNGAPIPEELQEIFWEGACVVAAHQYLVAQGKPGFVDAAGKPNSDYAQVEERIAAFQRLGGSVLAAYRRD